MQTNLVPMGAIGTIMNWAMEQAVANGANSISMPDEIVEVSHFLSHPAEYYLSASEGRMELQPNQGNRVPDWDAIKDKRMSELTPEQRDDAKELWLREQFGWFLNAKDHLKFLLDRLDAVRATGGKGNASVTLVKEEDQTPDIVALIEKGPEFAQGYYHAVAKLLGIGLDGQEIRDVFQWGPNPAWADASDIERFRREGWVRVQSGSDAQAISKVA